MEISIKGLMVDIDDTLISFIPEARFKGTTSLMDVLRKAGSELGSFSFEESSRIVEEVNAGVSWWSWRHFIERLGLDVHLFWDYAYKTESMYLRPAEHGIPEILASLKSHGIKLFITSNNPDDGIRHKLALAGFSAVGIEQIFDGIIDATGVRHMKWESEYWEEAVKRTALPRESLAVLGDSFNDDYLIPHSIGIPKTFLICRNAEKLSVAEGLYPVRSLREIKGFFGY